MTIGVTSEGYGADRKNRRPSRQTAPDTTEKVIQQGDSSPASVTGNVVFTALMIGLATIGLGLMTGYFPFTIIGFTIWGVSIIGGALAFLWQHRKSQ